MVNIDIFARAGGFSYNLNKKLFDTDCHRKDLRLQIFRISCEKNGIK
jgi:hypothetical protein